MLSLISAILCALCAIFCFVAVTALLKWLREQEKGYCEYCGQRKNNIILWIKNGTIRHICEECVKEVNVYDEKNE